jgi:hypothetical protein
MLVGFGGWADSLGAEWKSGDAPASSTTTTGTTTTTNTSTVIVATTVTEKVKALLNGPNGKYMVIGAGVLAFMLLGGDGGSRKR